MLSVNDNVTALLSPKHQLFAMPLAKFAEGNERCVPTPCPITLPTHPKATRQPLTTRGAASPPPCTMIHLPASMQQLRSSTSPNSHMQTLHRYPSSNAVRSFSRAASATTLDNSFNFLSKSYENCGNPAQAIIVNGVDADYTHAVGLPSSESRSFARGGACPTQWLPTC